MGLLGLPDQRDLEVVPGQLDLVVHRVEPEHLGLVAQRGLLGHWAQPESRDCPVPLDQRGQLEVQEVRGQSVHLEQVGHRGPQDCPGLLDQLVQPDRQDRQDLKEAQV